MLNMCNFVNYFNKNSLRMKNNRCIFVTDFLLKTLKINAYD
jgi:hypothetical protein